MWMRQDTLKIPYIDKKILQINQVSEFTLSYLKLEFKTKPKIGFLGDNPFDLSVSLLRHKII